MALFTTDWEKELDQVENRITMVLDEKVEPLFDRMITKASTEMSTQMSKAEFQMQETVDSFFAELTVQRKQTVTELKSLIRYAALMAFIVVMVSVAVIKIIALI